MHLKRFAIVLFLLAVSAMGQNPAPTPAMSHEETVVRSAYAKLAFAAQVGRLREIIDDWQLKPGSVDAATFASRMRDGEITFELSNIRFGDFSDIANVKYSDLVTKPNGEDVLSVTTGNWVFTTDEPKESRSVIATPSWTKAQILTENWEIPFGTIFAMAKDAGAEDLSPYSRYASVSVTVHFQGRSRSYRALFQFGRDAKGIEHILPIDTVTGNSALLFYIKSSVYPATLLETSMRNIPFVAQWLRNNVIGGAVAGKGEVACNLATLQCGLAKEDVQRALQTKSVGKLISPRTPGHPHLVQVSLRPKSPTGLFMQSDPCSVFNFSSGPTPGSTPVDTQLHITGSHFMTFNANSSCTYSSGNNSNGACNTSCQSNIGATANESGVTSSSCHEAMISQVVGGTGQANGAGTSCPSSVAMGVKSCLFCACSVSFSVSGSGASVSITSDGFYTVQQNNNQSCSQQTTQTGGGGGGGGGGDPCLGGGGGGFQPGSGTTPDPTCSPIIIDTEAQGFHLTSASGGVVFDIGGNGHPVQLAWTDPNFRNAFLALPGPDGMVHSGKQLFGNFTPQPPSDRPNGFIALAQYDKPENGGNGDGIIDSHDAIFSQLRLWIDENHDGISQPNELHSLPELGVTSISLRYHLSRLEDQYGNVFRYRSRVNPEPPDDQSEVGKTIYDVFFVEAK